MQHCHVLQVLDLDNGWLDHLDVGFDFSDILGADVNSSDGEFQSLRHSLNIKIDATGAEFTPASVANASHKRLADSCSLKDSMILHNS